MNARAVNAAADVICAAQKQGRTPAGIALALGSAQLLQSPVTAAEQEKLVRWHAEDAAEIARLVTHVGEVERTLLATWAAAGAPKESDLVTVVRKLAARVGELEAAAADRGRVERAAKVTGHPAHPAPCRVPSSPDCTCPADGPVLDPASFDRPGQRAAARMLNDDFAPKAGEW